MITTTIASELKELEACSEAVVWASNFDDPQQAWDKCERGDWMLWVAGKLCDRKQVVLAACECARIALVHTEDPGPLKTIETTERWCLGRATLNEVRSAADVSFAADAANAANAAAFAAYAANPATFASDAASFAANAASFASLASCAAYAAYATNAAGDEADEAARKETLIKCADITRRHFRQVPTLK